MQIVIDISEEDFERCKNRFQMRIDIMGDAIAKGTPLPKGCINSRYSEHPKYWYRCDRCGKDNLGDTGWCSNCGRKMSEIQTGSKS